MDPIFVYTPGMSQCTLRVARDWILAALLVQKTICEKNFMQARKSMYDDKAYSAWYVIFL